MYTYGLECRKETLGFRNTGERNNGSLSERLDFQLSISRKDSLDFIADEKGWDGKRRGFSPINFLNTSQMCAFCRAFWLALGRIHWTENAYMTPGEKSEIALFLDSRWPENPFPGAAQKIPGSDLALPERPVLAGG